MSPSRSTSSVSRPALRELTEQECRLVAGGSAGAFASSGAHGRSALPKGGFGSLAFEARGSGTSALPKGGY